MLLGISIIFLGLLLLPAGVKFLLGEYREFKVLHPDRGFVFYLIEVIDMFTGGGSLSTWLIITSLLLMIGGSLIIVFTH
jgi:hypothetical protein